MKPAVNMAKDMGRIAFWYPFRWLAQMLPLRAAPWVGKVLGFGDWALSGHARISRMKRNIRNALGQTAPVGKILLANLQSHGMNMVEFMKYPQMDAPASQKLVTWQNREALDDALGKGKGVILLTAHFGAKQFLQLAMGYAGYAVNQINYHLTDEYLSWVQKHVAQKQRMRIESSIPCHYISAKGFLRDTFRCLQANELLIIAADGIGQKQLMDASFLPFPFMGKTMFFPANYVSLARRTGATLLPCFILREGHRHRIVFHSPVVGEGEDAVRQYVSLLEQYVRRYPCFWEFWEELEEGQLLASRPQDPPPGSPSAPGTRENVCRQNPEAQCQVH